MDVGLVCVFLGIISIMKINQSTQWQVNTQQALLLQERLSKKVVSYGEVLSPRYIAGVDLSVCRFQQHGRAAIVVLSYPDMRQTECRVFEDAITFPYVPGLLSFRELPLILEVFKRITQIPEIVLVDGQGIAHPRRFGLASHLGLMLNLPAIGCAKSRLIGEYSEPGQQKGDFSYLYDGEVIIGAVVRTKTNVRPLFISIGHKISLENAIHWVLSTCTTSRLPEPTRQAHRAASYN
jgi:deoxyribonuclease V